MKKNTVVILMGFVALILNLGFQNCTKVGFTQTPPGAVPASADNTNSTTPPSAPTTVATTQIDVTTAPTPPAATPGPVVTIMPPTAAVTCKSRVLLTPVNGMINVPPRDDNKVCYYLKLIDGFRDPKDPTKYISQKSNLPTTINLEVVSRNHNLMAGNHTPYLMGKAMVNMTLQGERSIVLSSTSDQDTSIGVDNFLLIGVAPTANIGDPSFYQAIGSADSAVESNNVSMQGILFKNTLVPLNTL